MKRWEVFPGGNLPEEALEWKLKKWGFEMALIDGAGIFGELRIFFMGLFE